MKSQTKLAVTRESKDHVLTTQRPLQGFPKKTPPYLTLTPRIFKDNVTPAQIRLNFRRDGFVCVSFLDSTSPDGRATLSRWKREMQRLVSSKNVTRKRKRDSDRVKLSLRNLESYQRLTSSPLVCWTLYTLQNRKSSLPVQTFLEAKKACCLESTALAVCRSEASGVHTSVSEHTGVQFQEIYSVLWFEEAKNAMCPLVWPGSHRECLGVGFPMSFETAFKTMPPTKITKNLSDPLYLNLSPGTLIFMHPRLLCTIAGAPKTTQKSPDMTCFYLQASPVNLDFLREKYEKEKQEETDTDVTDVCIELK